LLRLVQRQDELADMINTTGTAFLGLTLGCARCHNHKFDPATQTDYYALQAVFAGVNHGSRTAPLGADEQALLAATEQRISVLQELLRTFEPHPVMAQVLLDDSQLVTPSRPGGVEYVR